MTKEKFIEQVKTEQNALRSFLLALCKGNSFKADDIAQQALLKAYLSHERFLGKSKFSTWLYRIAYNCFVDYQRTEASRGEGSKVELSKAADLEGAYEADERFRSEALYRAIDGLSENERTATLLFYMQGLPTRKIAFVMGLSDGAVRSCLSRARGHLKVILKPEI